MIYDYGSLRKGKRKERMNVFLRTMFFCRYCNCCELIVFRGTFMWCFIECLFYWVRILAIYWKYRRNFLLRNTHYLFICAKKMCGKYGNWKKKKRKEKIATYFPISLRSSTWNVTIYNLGIRNTLYSHFEQYNMTLKDRRTLTVVAIDKHDIFTFALTIFKLHTDVDVLPRLRILNSYYLSKGHLT